MLLKNYLMFHKISNKDFATLLGVSPPTVSTMCRGITKPKRPMLMAVMQMTSGAVQPKDFLRDQDEYNAIYEDAREFCSIK